MTKLIYSFFHSILCRQQNAKLLVIRKLFTPSSPTCIETSHWLTHFGWVGGASGRSRFRAASTANQLDPANVVTASVLWCTEGVFDGSIHDTSQAIYRGPYCLFLTSFLHSVFFSKGRLRLGSYIWQLYYLHLNGARIVETARTWNTTTIIIKYLVELFIMDKKLKVKLTLISLIICNLKHGNVLADSQNLSDFVTK